MENFKKIHFIGIGGAGMGGIAEVVVNQGYEVSGSDLSENNVTQHLEKLGVKFIKGHHENNITGVDLVVYSSAIPNNNPELTAAINKNIPHIPRAKMLALLMRPKYGIAIAGTHGKTTTTSLVASVLAQGDLQPTFVVGGRLESVGTNAQLGAGKYFVAEADESDASFLFLKPKIAIITNIDSDHLNTYNGEMSALCDSFLQFVAEIPPDGLVVICADDEIAISLQKDIKAPTLTYGFNPQADIQITAFSQCGLESCFHIVDKINQSESDVRLSLAGKHNALNALAAIAVARKLEVPEEKINKALSNFMGIGRRFQIYGEVAIPDGEVTVIDDYGHHPREIAATLDAIRLVWPDRRVVMAYQPHRYTRTFALMQEFANILSIPDVLLLLDVYSAGEEPIQGADSQSLCQQIKKIGKISPYFVPSIDQLPDAAKQVLKDGDIFLIQGAGSIGQMAAKLFSKKTEQK